MNEALHFQSSCLIKQHNHSWMLVFRPVLNFHLTWRTAQHCSWWIGPHCSERSWLEDLRLDFLFLDSPELKLDPPPLFFLNFLFILTLHDINYFSLSCEWKKMWISLLICSFSLFINHRIRHELKESETERTSGN